MCQCAELVKPQKNRHKGIALPYCKVLNNNSRMHGEHRKSLSGRQHRNNIASRNRQWRLKLESKQDNFTFLTFYFKGKKLVTLQLKYLSSIPFTKQSEFMSLIMTQINVVYILITSVVFLPKFIT